MKNKKNSSLYLLCSPNIGLLDNWLPVVHKLKKGLDNFRGIIS